VGDSRITEFGKSSLEVTDHYDAPGTDPIELAAAGGPYLVYPDAGKVVRLGRGAQIIPVGGALGQPVATSDGTVWLPRTSAGLLCQLPRDADRVTCPIRLPKGHSGAMSVVDDQALFVDTTADTVHTVDGDGLGEPTALGVDVSDDARVASTDASGRLVILDQKAHRMHLVDTTGETKPVHVDMPGDHYTGPVATGSVIAVVDQQTGTLNTYDTDGAEREKTPLPQESGTPRITRGEDDRVYVDGAQGEHVLVVDRDGGVAQVPVVVDGKPATTEADEDREHDDDVAAGPPQQGQPQQPPQQTPPPQPPVQEAPQDTGPPEVSASPPGAPPGVQAVPGDAAATVSWGAAPDNQSAITGYTVSWPGGQTTVGGGARSATVPGLVNGTSYVFTVTATNAVGTGPGASSNPVVPNLPATAPGAPASITVFYYNGTANLSWTPPADLGTGTLAHYLVGVTGMPSVTVPPDQTSYTYEGITTTGPGTITVQAVTTTADGQTLTGPPVTWNVEDFGATGTVTLTRGADTDEWCGPDPACAWMHIQLIGMAPNTAYDLMPHSTDASYTNPGYTITTDDTGWAETEQFAYAGAGNTVWVIATSQADGAETRSNDLPWEAG
jgi:fibronectin type III domain protein